MARPSSVHVCSECGHEAARWAGRCPGCGEWNSMVEQVRATPTRGSGSARGLRGSAAAAPVAAVTPIALGQVEAVDHERLSTGIGEPDSVLGGGIVPGCL